MQAGSRARWRSAMPSGRSSPKAPSASRAAVLSETGLRTVFHHHCAGYVETPDEIARFLDLTDPGLVGLVFDTGHYAYGAGGSSSMWSPASIVSGTASGMSISRTASLPLQPRPGRGVGTISKRCATACFASSAKGASTFPRCCAGWRARAYDGYVLVEQDVLPGMGAPAESARRNREYLRSIEGITP